MTRYMVNNNLYQRVDKTYQYQTALATLILYYLVPRQNDDCTFAMYKGDCGLRMKSLKISKFSLDRRLCLPKMLLKLNEQCHHFFLSLSLHTTIIASDFVPSHSPISMTLFKFRIVVYIQLALHVYKPTFDRKNGFSISVLLIGESL